MSWGALIFLGESLESFGHSLLDCQCASLKLPFGSLLLLVPVDTIRPYRLEALQHGFWLLWLTRRDRPHHGPPARVLPQVPQAPEQFEKSILRWAHPQLALSLSWVGQWSKNVENCRNAQFSTSGPANRMQVMLNRITEAEL